MSIVALLHGTDQPGLVARLSSWIFERGGNILHADQHHDSEHNIFFQRIEWEAEKNSQASDLAGFRHLAENDLGMHLALHDSEELPRVGIMVSKTDHCFHDLLLRFASQEFAGQAVGVYGNHTVMQEAAQGYGVPFTYLPVSKDTKAEAEAALLQQLEQDGVELLILARYMQVLSKDFLDKFGKPVINIHHSFLPAFAGGRPYHQAHQRGVKIIGATAHYVTEDLDEGPIIQQDVAYVNHRHTVADLVRRGKDLEKTVLAQAVRWHLEHRILRYRNKTVVFD